MGGRNGGRYPKPLEYHEANGNPSCLDLDTLKELAPSPAYLEEVPSPPDTLGDMAAECWKINAPVLWSMKTLTAADLDTFYDYCVLFGAKMEAKDALDAMGGEGVIDMGTDRRRPGMAAPLKVYLEVSKAMREIAREFGMTASARARMTISVEKRCKDEDEMESILGD